MSDLLGINHLTLTTIDLDRLVAYYTGLLGAELAFERAATVSDPRFAVVDVGGNDHLMIVETDTSAPSALPTPPADSDLDPPNSRSPGPPEPASPQSVGPLGSLGPHGPLDPLAPLDPVGRAGWGLRVAAYSQLCEVRERILDAGLPAGPIETLPTQWTMTVHDRDGRSVDVRAHRDRGATA